MDLKNILKVDSLEDDSPPPNIVVHKKPIQLTDIERRSKKNNQNNQNNQNNDENNINHLIDLEKDKIYNQPWNKLDNGLKLNRLLLYTHTLKDKYSLNDSEFHNLQDMLKYECDKNRLSKSSVLIYNKETALIENIKKLEFNDDKRIFKLERPSNKVKKPHKSNSNIERLLMKHNN
jgi:hypothetical protein